MMTRMTTLLPLPSAHTSLVALACFLGTTVYAFCLLFAAVIMPGLSSLDSDADYLRAFQVIDGTIQNNQFLFILSWVGSMFVAIALAVMNIVKVSSKKGASTMLLACVIFLLGHVITGSQHIPRNNRLHALDIANADTDTLADLRPEFEGPWCFWNSFRTVLFAIATLFWIIALVYTEPPVDSTKQSFDSPPEVEARFNQVV